MSDKSKSLTEQELKLIEDVELFMEEVYKDPAVANVKAPANLKEKVFEAIRAREAEKAAQAREMLCSEDKELIRLGKLYKKKRRVRKYLVLAAMMVFVLAFGITSVGNSEKIAEILNWRLANREQVNVDSNENIVPMDNVEEEEVYQRIEDEFGFLPVKMNYLPENVGFLEAEVSEEITRIYMLYGEKQDARISYIIRPNYRESSWGKDIEDELLEKSEIMVNDVKVYVKKYRVAENRERWLVGFVYKNTSYSIMLMNLEEVEVEKIIRGLYFP